MNLSHKQIQEQLILFFGDSLKINEPLNRHCTFKIGGPAEFFVEVRSLENIREALKFLHDENIPFIVIGAGSNVLFPDEGLTGVTMRIYLDSFNIEGDLVYVQAGMPLPKLSVTVTERGLSGLEFASGIPGTIGGAVTMNAGFMEDWIGTVVERVLGYDYAGMPFDFRRENLNFKYRTSSLRNTRKLITEITLRLKPDSPENIKTKMKRYREHREAAQPLGLPSAGSIFKNPDDRPAWRLIEEAGCKGLRIGGAQVSEKHGNYIVNMDNATYSDIMELIQVVTEHVSSKSGVHLEMEVLDLGDIARKRKEPF